MFYFHIYWKHQKICFFLFFFLMGYRNGILIWVGLMLTNSSFFKYCASIFNIMCGSWAFHSAKLYLIIAGNKNIYIPFITCIQCEKLIFSKVKLKMVWKTHFLSHNNQPETRQLWRFSKKSKIFDCHFCCVWDRICLFNGFYCVLFSTSVCTLFIFIVLFYLLI